ncbi:MAG: hypothetical protein ACE5I3_07190 [Phycisphaerae bacterium]
MLAFALSSGPVFVAPTTCSALLLLIALLVFVLTALRLQYRTGEACRQQARLARETWAAPQTEERT